MQRLSIVLLLMIVLLAGFTAGIACNRPIASAPVLERPADVETARAFYRALNDALSGAGTEPLSALLANYYVQHEVGTEETQSAEAFLERLGTIARSSPGIRLDIESIESLGSSLVVTVRRTPAAAIRVAGLAVEQPVEEHGYDVLRIVQGKVIERWTSGIGRLEATTFDDLTLHTYGLVGVTPAMERIVMPVGTQLSWTSGAQAMLFVESGSARITASVSGEETAMATLDGGMAMAIPADASHRVRSVGGDDLAMLIYASPSNTAPTYSSQMGAARTNTTPALEVFDEWDEGVAQTVLWQEDLEGAGLDRVHRAGRIVLPAGEAVDILPEPGALVLVSSDGGGIEIAAPGGAISTLAVDASPKKLDSVARIDASRAAFIDANGPISVQNTTHDPLTLLLIAIEPAP